MPPRRSSTPRAVDRTHLASDLSPRSRPYRSECERYRSTLLAAPIGALGGLVAARRSARATRGDVPGREVLAFGTKGGKSVENGEKRSLLEQKGEIQQKEIEFHRISSKFGQIRLKRQFLGYGRTDGRTENYPAQSLSTSFLGPPEFSLIVVQKAYYCSVVTVQQ